MSQSIATHAPEHLIDPTRTMYAGLQDAYDHLNEHLFRSTFSVTLPNCLLTLRATGRTYGYFSAERFVGDDGKLTHEIALNPASFACRSVELSLSTLAHEMVHLLQHIDGSAGRTTYHNQAFADRMEAIGLITSNTGRPGGKRVAQTMSHYIQPDGPFIMTMRDFLADGFRARWADRFTGALKVAWEPDHPPLAPASLLTQGHPVRIGEPDDDDEGALAGQAGTEGAPAAAAHPLGFVDEPDLSPSDINAAISALSRSDPDDPDPDEGTTGVPEAHKPMEEPLASKIQGVFVHGAYRTKGATRRKYQCPGCEAAVWGKPKLNITCGDCEVAFADVG